MTHVAIVKKRPTLAPDRLHHVFEFLGTAPLTRGMAISFSVSAVLLFGVIGIIQQTQTAQDIPYEHIGLEGALCAAVVVLWRALAAKDTQIAAKDAQLVAGVKVMTEALVAAATSNAELRKIIEDSVSAKNHLTQSLDLLRSRLESGPDCGDHVSPRR